MSAFTILPAFLACAAPLGQSAAPISLDSLLKEMNDRAVVARAPEHTYTCKQFSSYARASKTPSDPAGWFANDDYGHVLGERNVSLGDGQSRKEFVLADCTGPGAIVRIWTPNPQGTLRIYIDGNEKPVIEGSMQDLMSGKGDIPPPLAADHSRGWNIYLPIPYAKSCVITTDANKGLYYQVNYRTYDAATAVQSLTSKGFKDGAGVIADAGKLLTDPPRPVLNGPPVNGELPPRRTMETGGPLGPHAFTGFVIKMDAKDMAKALRQVIVRMDFDHEKTVWVPLGDFFGVGPDTKPFRTHYLEYTHDKEMIARFVMPYERQGRLFIDNKSDEPVKLEARIAAVPMEFNDKTMRFHAAWHYAPSIKTEAAKGTEDFNFVNVQGNGAYVGDILTVFNPVQAWWGEGDEHISVDGEAFPSHFGTGTEDYYGYGWCDQHPFFAPFNGQLRCEGFNPHGRSTNRGFTTVTRQRSLDAIPFTKSLNFDMEVWHWAKTDVSYSATTFFYALPDAKVNREPQLEDALKPLPELKIFTVPGAIECESLKVTAKSPDAVIEPQEMSGFGDSQWSNETQLWVKGKKIGDFVELLIPAADTGKKKLKIRVTKSWDYGIVSFKVNGEAAAENVDLFSGKKGVVAAADIDLGEHAPVDGAFVLRCELTGANKNSEMPQTFFGLDCVQISGS